MLPYKKWFKKAKKLKYLDLAIVVVEPLQLDLGAGAEIDEECSRITGTAEALLEATTPVKLPTKHRPHKFAG